jgi:hypothetical protein
MVPASKPYVVLDSQSVRHHPAGYGIVVCSFHCQIARLSMHGIPVIMGTRWWKPQLSCFSVMVDDHDDDHDDGDDDNDDDDNDGPYQPGC